VIELVEGMWFNPDKIVAVKAIGKDKCVLWTAGQPSTEGHVLDFPADEVVQAIEESFTDDGDEEDVEEE